MYFKTRVTMWRKYIKMGAFLRGCNIAYCVRGEAFLVKTLS